jgi:hypothetical protein
MIEPFGVMQQRFDGEQPIPRRNPKKKKASAKKNNHRVWEQIIEPFSVTEPRTYGRQPIGRRNPAGAHGAFDQMIDPFGVMQQRFDGEQPYARRNDSQSVKAPPPDASEIYASVRRILGEGTPDSLSSDVRIGRYSIEIMGETYDLLSEMSALGESLPKTRHGRFHDEGGYLIWRPNRAKKLSPSDFHEEMSKARSKAERYKAKKNGVVRVYKVK